MLAASRRRTSWLAGVAGGIAAFFKVAFLVPVVAIVAAAASPLLAAGALLGTVAVGAAASALAFGSAFWREAFQAQAQTGLHSLHYTAGLWVQAGWNLIALGVPAIMALRDRAAARDKPLLRAVVAGTIGSLALLLSLLKQGSYLNALVVIEPAMLILAACGLTWVISERRGVSRRRDVLIAAGALAIGVVQVGSLLASPTRPTVFGRPFAASPPGWLLRNGQVDRQVALIRRCPSTVAYSGPPFLALAGARRMPGNEPDQFIIEHAAANRRFMNAAERATALPVNAALRSVHNVCVAATLRPWGPSSACPHGGDTAWEAGQLVGVSGQKVGQWARRGYIRSSVSDGRPRMYSFQDVAEAMVVHDLLERGVNLTGTSAARSTDCTNTATGR